MPIPTKVPTEYAYDTLNRSNRGHDRFERVTMVQLEALEEHHLVKVYQLRPFFANNAAYKDYRNGINVGNNYWQRTIGYSPNATSYARRYMRRASRSPSPAACRSRSRSPAARRSRSRSPAASRSRSRSPSPRRSRSRSPLPLPPHRYKRGELKMWSKLGPATARELRQAERSTIAIAPSGDECDDQDVNLTKPSCKQIRKVCRTYNPSRRYTETRRDGSENKDYNIRVSYKTGRNQ